MPSRRCSLISYSKVMCIVLFFILVLTSHVTAIHENKFEMNHNVSSGINDPVCYLVGFIHIKEPTLVYLNSSLEFYQYGGSIQSDMKCEAPYPIDIEFDGLLPKYRELQVEFVNEFQDEDSNLKPAFYVWIIFYLLKEASYSGKYSVFSVDHPIRRTSIYVFDEKYPQLFRTNIDSNGEIRRVENTTTVIIGCKCTMFDVDVLLFRYHRHTHKKMKLIGPSKSLSYDPTRGFTWNMNNVDQLLDGEDDVRNFTYVCKCKSCRNESNSLEFTLAHSKEEPSSDDRETVNLTMFITVVNGETQISCTNINIYNHQVPIVTNIYAQNPRQLRLDLTCDGKRQTHQCEEKRTIGNFNGNTAILRSAYSQGLASCSNSEIKISREYFRGMNDFIYYDWNIAKKSTDALLKIKCHNHEKIYANLTYTFSCAFVSYILSPPSFFQIHYEDGSTQSYLYESDYLDRTNERTREVSFPLFSNISKVSCSSLPWNSSVLINSSMDFILRDKSPPEFKTKIEYRKFLMKSATATKLQCEADGGDELPEMRWEKQGMIFNETNLAIEYEPGRSTITFPQIRLKHKGDYKCIATNSMGNDTKIFRIDVEESSETDYELLAGLSTVGVLAILVIIVIASFITSRHYYKKKVYLSQEEIEEFESGCKTHMRNTEAVARVNALDSTRFVENIHYGPYDNKYEIHSSKFQIDRSCILGSGQFGIVYKGLFNHEPIAIKTLKPYTEKIYLKALLSEIKVMIYINGHNHIVNLVGANTEALNRGEVYAFVEFCPLGSLEGFLRRHQTNFVNQITAEGSIIKNNVISDDGTVVYTKVLVLWSLQISSGMEYLTDKKVIHGDLATRNILLANRETVKITDFGLSKKLYDYAIYERKNRVWVPLPWRWMAIESLQNWTFSTKTDVWALGVTLWEIFTLANVPYPGLSWSPDFVKQLQFGMRMSQPDYACVEIYAVMLRCWEINPNDRPSFTYLKEFFTNYMKKFLPSTNATTNLLQNN